MYQYSKEQIKADKRHSKKLSSIVKGVSVAYLAWWALFQSKNPDYEPSNNSNYPDQELVNELNEYANENGFKNKNTANNDELIDYAVLLFTAVLADRVVNYTRTQLLKDKTYTAEMGAKMYKLVDNELADDIIDKAFHGHVWSTDIWKHQAALRSDLLSIMRQSLLNKETPMSSVTDIRDKYHVFNYQSERILRTEGAYVSVQQQKADIMAADLKKVERVVSPGACHICVPHDGEIFPISELGSSSQPLVFHSNCRCTVVAVI